MRILTLLGFAAITLTLTSCSDDEPTTPTATGSYVRASGSYVIHSNVDVDIDAATGKTTDIPAPDDSTVVVQRSSAGGAETSVAHVFVGGESNDTVTITQNGSIVMQDFAIRYDVVSFVLDLGRKQVMVADFSKSSWTALKDTIAPFDFTPLPGVKLSGSLNFIGKQLADESVTINNTTLQTKKVQLDLNATLYANLGVSSVPVPISLVRTIWFADGIGIVKTEQKAAVINLGPAGALLGTSTQAVPGYTQTAKRWSN